MPVRARRGWEWPRARVVRVVDADTLDVELDRGFYDRSVRRLRLAAVNAPERDTPEGRAAVDWLVEWLHVRDALPVQSADLPPSRWPLVALTERADAYGGRWDGWLWAAADGECLNVAMVAAGHATPWPKGGVS
jgi:endonuclease YncB( thermonuclease family)